MEGQSTIPAQLAAPASDAIDRYMQSGENVEPNTVQLNRSHPVYKRMNQRFEKKKVKFTSQFSHIYLNRLLKLRPSLFEAGKQKWPTSRVVEKVIDIAAGDEVVAIGTLFKEQSLKSDVLDEFSNEFDGGKFVREERANYCSDDDTLILEDESGRMMITGFQDTKDIDRLVTGVVCAVKGRLLQSGEFQLEQPGGICFPKPLAVQVQGGHEGGSDPRYVLLLSGLDTGGNHDPIKAQLLVNYLLGHLASDSDNQLQKSIVRVIIAGNSISATPLPSTDASDAIVPLKQLDLFLAELASSTPVDVMPGATDPTTFTLPQQPLHACFFPQASRFSTLQTVTNPYECGLENRLVITGNSGQPIDDLKKYTRGLTAIELMAKTLEWQHMAPTAPDTLPCYPLTERDPFLFAKTPHVYFCGNQEGFATVMHNQTRLITVPKFAETGVAVLVNIDSPTLECSAISVDGLVLE